MLRQNFCLGIKRSSQSTCLKLRDGVVSLVTEEQTLYLPSTGKRRIGMYLNICCTINPNLAEYFIVYKHTGDNRMKNSRHQTEEQGWDPALALQTGGESRGRSLSCAAGETWLRGLCGCCRACERSGTLTHTRAPCKMEVKLLCVQTHLGRWRWCPWCM